MGKLYVPEGSIKEFIMKEAHVKGLSWNFREKKTEELLKEPSF